jgi:hypothetical protein
VMDSAINRLYLGGDHHGVHSLWGGYSVDDFVLDRHLGLAVGPHPGEGAVLAHLVR